jgi:hypothetical protein
LSKYFEEHTSSDNINGVITGMSRSPENENPRVNIFSAKSNDDEVSTIYLGAGGVLPVVGEFVDNTKCRDDFLSAIAYSTDNPDISAADAFLSGYDRAFFGISDNDDWGSVDINIRRSSAARLLTKRFMKARQSLTIDSISHNSHGMVIFGSAAKYIHPPVFSEKDGFGAIARQLSTFNLFRIDKERAIVAFNEKGEISLAINRDALVDGFRGMIGFEILDATLSIERSIFTKRVLITDDLEDIQYIVLPDGVMIDDVKDSGFEDIVEVLASSAPVPVEYGNGSIVPGGRFVINKTSRNVRVTMDNGEALFLDPFGIVKTSGETIVATTTYRETYVRPATVNCNTSGELYKRSPLSKTRYADGFFLEHAGRIITDIRQDGITEYKSDGPNVGIGSFSAYINISSYTIEQFGDTDNPIFAMRADGIDMYLDHGNLYVKKETDLNFTMVDPENSRNPDTGYFEHYVAGKTFRSKNRIRTGSVHRDRHFVYEMNYSISMNAVLGESIGVVFPVGFFRVTRQKTGTCRYDNPYALPDGHNNAKNEYWPSDVTRVESTNYGTLIISNFRDPEIDFINYSYTAALTKASTTPFVIESFGYVSRETMTTIPGEHFVSKKVKESAISDTKKRYCGTIDSEFPEYRAMWVKVQNIETRDAIIFIEAEYDDEHSNFLGYSSAQNPGPGCDDISDLLPKPNSYTNMLSHRQKWCDGNGTLKIQDIQTTDMYVNSSDPIDYRGMRSGIADQSTNHIGGFRTLAKSLQTPTYFQHSKIVRGPEIVTAEGVDGKDFRLLVVPHIGAVFSLPINIDVDTSIFSETPIIEPFKRGVHIELGDRVDIYATIEYNENGNLVESKYVFHDRNSEISSDIVTITEFPEGSTNPNFNTRIYNTTRTPEEHGHRSEYLANYLFLRYGYIQGILSVWDESSGIIINDSDYEILADSNDVGHKLRIKCSGADPIITSSRYRMMAVHKGLPPFEISEEFFVTIAVIGTVDGFDSSAIEIAESKYDSGDSNGATLEIVSELATKLKGVVRYRARPLYYTMQGPWVPTVLSANSEEFLMLHDRFDIKILPHRRFILPIKVGMGNTARFNMPARSLTKMYTKIDGYVDEEVVNDEKRSPIQRGNTTYSVKYRHNIAADIILDRDIYVDMEMYPSRLSYPQNNAIRELITPIREDGHDKKMDARAVYARFDTRYIYESIKSYYDKFIEMPTAFTCDLAPEELIFNTTFKATEFLYMDKTVELSGEEIATRNGFVRMSFDNQSDDVESLSVTFDNHKRLFYFGSGFTSYDINDVVPIIRSGLFCIGYDEEFAVGRIKSGVYLKNTMIEEQ